MSDLGMSQKWKLWGVENRVIDAHTQADNLNVPDIVDN
jgi:hypothetical protein